MIEILKAIPFFAHLPEADLQAIIENVQMQYFPADHVIFKQGDPGDIMYIIKRGTVQVIRNNTVIATLAENRFFGEMALVSSDPRSATVKTVTDLEVLILKREDFRHLLETNANIATMVSYEVIKRINENS